MCLFFWVWVLNPVSSQPFRFGMTDSKALPNLSPNIPLLLRWKNVIHDLIRCTTEMSALDVKTQNPRRCQWVATLKGAQGFCEGQPPAKPSWGGSNRAKHSVWFPSTLLSSDITSDVDMQDRIWGGDGWNKSYPRGTRYLCIVTYVGTSALRQRLSHWWMLILVPCSISLSKPTFRR